MTGELFSMYEVYIYIAGDQCIIFISAIRFYVETSCHVNIVLVLMYIIQVKYCSVLILFIIFKIYSINYCLSPIFTMSVIFLCRELDNSFLSNLSIALLQTFQYQLDLYSIYHLCVLFNFMLFNFVKYIQYTENELFVNNQMYCCHSYI